MAESSTEKKTSTRTRKTASAAKSESEAPKKQRQPKAEPVAEQKPQQEMYSKEAVEAMIASAVAEAVAKAVAQAQTQQAPQIVQIAADVERVQFLYMAEVADDNVYEIGPGGMYGRIVGKTGAFSVPKSDLSRVMDSMFRLMMQRRWIVVVSGMNAEEREAYGVDYKDGEVLDKRAFQKMIDLGDEILNIYPKLCAGHREMVAKRYYESYMSGMRPKRETVVELNRMSKALGSENGDFTTIIELMNEADAK